MSPRTGQLLLDGVRPIIRASLAKGAVTTVGCEDLQELEADGMAQAASMLESAELAGKEVSASSVAFYTLQALKSGRRYGSANRTDAMAPATQLDGNSVMLSMDEPLFIADLDDDEGDTGLHQCLAATGEDPAFQGSRELDWDAAAAELDDRELVILGATAAGFQGAEVAAAFNVSAPRITQIKRGIGGKLRYGLGNDAMADCVREPRWQGGLRAHREKRACRYT